MTIKKGAKRCFKDLVNMLDLKTLVKQQLAADENEKNVQSK